MSKICKRLSAGALSLLFMLAAVSASAQETNLLGSYALAGDTPAANALALDAGSASGDLGSGKWLTGGKAHKYLGLTSVGLMGLGLLMPKEDHGPHRTFMTAAAASAAAAATTGFIYHWNDFDWSDGLTEPENVHMLLGLLGTLGMLAAISKAPGDGHAGVGAAGGAMMAIAVTIVW